MSRGVSKRSCSSPRGVLRELVRTYETLLVRAQKEILSPQGLEIYLTPAQTAQPAPQPKLARTQDYTSHLSADLRFETFYESACNREALRIAEATAARPGQAPLNFIFIYGPSGVGKTHLSQAIGQRAMELIPRCASATCRARSLKRNSSVTA